MSEPEQQWIDDPVGLRAFCDELSQESVIGLDTEFIGEGTFHPRLCLVQIATPRRLAVIDPLALPSMASIWDLIVDPARTVVVHAGREEIRIARQACGRAPAGLFDLQIAAGLVGLGYPVGYAALVRSVLAQSLTKSETMTDWSRRPLSAQQRAYAFDDVRHLLPMHAVVAARLRELRREEWLREEMAALERHALSDDPLVERWRRLKGIGSLDRKRLAVVRELFAWREELAEQQNRPVRSVLRDDLLVEIARRLPQHERDFAALRGVAARDHPAILHAVRRARALPPTEWPAPAERDFEPAPVAVVAGLLLAALTDLCARWALAPALVATSSDVKRWVRHRFEGGSGAPEDSELGRGWRSRHILPLLERVLEGRCTIGIGDLHSDAPLRWDGDPLTPPMGD